MEQKATLRLRIIVLSFLSFFILFSNTSQGQAATAVWPMTSNGNAVVTGNVTAGATTGGSGLSGYAVYTSCGGYSHNWSQNSTTVGTNQYAQFTITPVAGNNLTANTLKLHTYATSSSGTCCPVGCAIAAYYSLDNFATFTLFTGALFPGNGDDGDCTLSAQDSYSLGGVSVPNGSTLTIRVYGYATNTTSDRLYIGNVEIDGTTTSACTAPTITSFSPASACSGSGATITINGANYVNGATTVTINGVSATPVTYVNSGQITVPLPAGASGTGNIVVTTTCPVTSSTTFTVTTIPATPGAITGNANICSGSLDTFSIASVSGAASYTWSLPGTWAGTSTTNIIYTTAGTGGGTVSVTADNTCGNSTAQTMVVNVTTAAPATPGAISGTATECSGHLDTFSIASVSGATSYTWSLPNGWTGTSTTNTIYTTAGTSGGTVSVTANNICGSSAAATLAVTVNSAPATPGTIFGEAAECSGALDTFAVLAVSGATSYTWSLPTGWTNGNSVINAITANAGSSGTVSVTANNTCGSSAPQTFSVVVTSSPATPGAITGRTPACSGSLDTFSIAVVSGATTYTWSLPNGWTGTSTTNTIIATAGPAGGTVSVTAGNSCGTSTAQTLAVTIATAPATPGAISGTATVCSGHLDTFSIASVSGATSYTWSLPNGWTGTSTTNTIYTTAGTSGGTVSVTANNICGSSAAATLAVTVNSAPATPGTIFGEAAECSGALDTFAVLAVSGATSYTWSLPTGWTNGNSVINAITANAGSSGTVSVTANNACGSSAPQTFSVVVTSPPATPGAITGRTPACNGSLDTFSIAVVSGATTYTWSLPNGWTGTSTTTTIVATAGSAGGTVSVTAGNSCGTSTAQTLAVTIATAPATPGAISGTATVCSGHLDTFSIASVSGATSYTWSLPNGWTGTSTTNTIYTTAGTSGGTVSVTANNICGSSAAATFAVTVNSAPATPGTISGHAVVCASGSLDTFSIAPVNGATSYTWTLPNGWTGTSTSTTINTTAGPGGGNVSVTANNSCGSSSAQTLAVTIGTAPATPGAITGAAGVCTSGSLDTFSIAPVNGASSYTWTLPNGWTGTSTTATIVATAGTNGGTVTVIANNACGSSSPQTLAVTVGAAPATPGAITSRSSGCNSGSIDTFSVAPVSGASSYTWTLPNGWTGTSATYTIITTVGTNGGTVSVTANNGCGSSAASTLAVTVGTGLATPGPISGLSVVCIGRLDTFSITPVSGATSYIWTLPNGWTGTSTSTSIAAMTGSTAGFVTVVARNSCGNSAPSTLPVSTTTLPPPTPGLIGGPANVCAGARDSFYVTAVARTSSYTWTLPNGWTGTSTTDNIIAMVGSIGGIIIVTAENGCGTSSARTKTDTVNPLPAVVFNFAKNPVCNGQSNAVILNMGTPAGGTYTGPGVTGNTFFNTTALSPGDYILTYTYTSPAGCTASDTANFQVINCTGIENTEADQITVYPNPFTDAITIHTNGNYGNGTAVLTDATGREVNRAYFNAEAVNVQLNTSAISGGIYMLSISVEGKLIAVKKLVRTE